MSVSGQVSVSSSIGTSLVFTVTGTQTLAYAQQFQNILLGAKTVNEAVLNTGETATVNGSDSGPQAGTYTLNLNEITAGFNPTIPGSGQYTLPGGEAGAITFVDQNGSSTVTGSGSGDYVLFTGINPSNTYIDVGGGNTVIFTAGDNTYEGEKTDNTTGTDYIIAGSGHDTINTGVGDTHVFSGTGQAQITLNDTQSQTTVTGTDTVFSGIFNDLVILNDGVNTVNAAGASDDIVATAPKQVIESTSTIAGAAAIVTILGSGPAGDIILGGSATIAVFDSVGGNEFFGDSVGQAYYIAGPNTADTIVGGGGHSALYMFGSSGTDISLFASSASESISGFAAGLGNETLNGSGFAGPLELFANNTTDQVAAAAINETLIGGSGINAFITGEGNESIVGGGAGNAFYIQHTNDGSDANTGTITISNFASNPNWDVYFGGYSQAEITQSEATATVGTLNDPSYTIKLSDGTTVQFLGVNSLSGHGG